MKEFSKHPCYMHAEDFRMICRPLEKLNISYFSHVRIDSKGNFSGLVNHPQFLKHYLDNKYYNADIHLAKEDYLSQYILWDAFDFDGETDKMNREAWQMNVKHTFTIVQINQDDKEFYHFSTHLDDKSINQVYLSNCDLLNNFIDYFKEKIANSKDLRKAYDFKLSIDAEYSTFSFFHNNVAGMVPKKLHIIDFLNEDRSRKSNFFLQHIQSKKIISITPQQFRCFHLLLKCFSIKEIARLMNLSPRTVEYYLKELRQHLNCKNSKELITQFAPINES